MSSKLSQTRERTGLDAGPAACGYEDQCWTLARITDQAWQRFGAEYTLGGVHVLLYRIGWSVQVPARRAAERDEAAVAAWREEPWPVKRTAAEQGTWLVFEDESGQGFKAPEGPDLGAARPDPGGDGDRRQQQESVAGRADRGEGRAAAPAALPRSLRPPRRYQPEVWTLRHKTRPVDVPRITVAAGLAGLHAGGCTAELRPWANPCDSVYSWARRLSVSSHEPSSSVSLYASSGLVAGETPRPRSSIPAPASAVACP
jgi:hypothetical protein